MEPAIPHNARIRIRTRESVDYREGEIVACVVGDSLFAHRIVYCGQGSRTRGFVVTQGDGWMLCDPPTHKERILGIVAEFCDRDRWTAPPPPADRGWVRGIIRKASLWLVRLSLAVHYEVARRVAGFFLTVGALCKAATSVSAQPKS